MSYNLLLTFELIRTVECVRALSLFSVHCNAKVDCVFELSRKEDKKNTKKEKKKKKRKEKNIKIDKKSKEKKREESEEDGGCY